MTIDIPVKPHILRYLKEKYGIKDFYIISRRHALDFLLVELLEPKQRKYSPLVGASCILKVEIPASHDYNNLVHISEESIAAFNHFADEMMKVEFIGHMDALVNDAGFDIRESICNFIYKYDFTEEELSFESLKQHYFRTRRRLESTANIG